MPRILQCVLACAFAITPVAAQENAATWNSRWEQLLAVVFDAPPQVSTDLAVVTLRFFPSFQPEAQCVLKFTEGGGECSCTTVGESLAKVFSSAAEDEPVESIAKRVQIRKESRSLDRKAGDRMLKELWRAFGDSPQQIQKRLGMVQLDGTTYEIHVATGLSDTTMNIRDQEALRDRLTGNVAIVRWANSVRLSMLR